MATFEFPFSCDRNTFLTLMTEDRHKLSMPYGCIVDKRLEHLLLVGLITRYEKDRMTLTEFFEHPYVVEATKEKLRTRNEIDMEMDEETNNKNMRMDEEQTIIGK